MFNRNNMADKEVNYRIVPANVSYTYKPTETALAKFDGINARCGTCNHKLGEFLKADGEIKCKCGVKNKVKI